MPNTPPSVKRVEVDAQLDAALAQLPQGARQELGGRVGVHQQRLGRVAH
jgi:hypothetical protein